MSSLTAEKGPAGAYDQAAAGNPEARKLESYPALDWLRWGLASLVAITHFDITLPAPLDGHFGVEVFLALSGWLIGGILLRSIREDLPRFFFNRATRIWLPYATAIAILYALALVREGFSLNWFKYLFYDTTFTHYTFTHFPKAGPELPLGGSGNQFWSLSVEEQFYLLTPLFMFILPFGKKIWGWAVLGVAALALQSVAAPITLGVIAAVLQKDYGDWHMGRIARPLVIGVTIGLFVGAHIWNDPTIRALLSVMIVLSLAFPGKRGAVGLFLGGLSYPFYLNHWIGGFTAHGLVKHFHLPTAAQALVAYVLAFVVSTILWWLVDRPVMAHRLGWYRPILGRGFAITAYALVITGLIGGLIFMAMGYGT